MPSIPEPTTGDEAPQTGTAPCETSCRAPHAAPRRVSPHASSPDGEAPRDADGRAPGGMDRPSTTPRSTDGRNITIHLGYQPPYRFDALLNFFRMRELSGVEAVGPGSYLRTARIALPNGGEARGWVRVENDADSDALAVTLSASLAPALPQVARLVRHQFDLDAGPHAIQLGIASLNDVVPGAAVPGTRLPGCFDPFETAMRAVLGQQITVAAANKLAARIAKAYGTPTEFGEEVRAGQPRHPEDAMGADRVRARQGHFRLRGAEGFKPDSSELSRLTRFFPTAAEVLQLGPIEDALGALGVIKTRSRTIAEIARQLTSGELNLEPGANAQEQMERLLAIKGIGPWSANYIAMRTLGHPDAFLETDAGIRHALPDLTPKERLALAEQWRPWRSYANVCLWNSLAAAASK